MYDMWKILQGRQMNGNTAEKLSQATNTKQAIIILFYLFQFQDYCCRPFIFKIEWSIQIFYDHSIFNKKFKKEWSLKKLNGPNRN
jgi:hypothetical protein